MEFLDPVAKKKRGRRLILGYILVAIMILVGSTIITYWSYGFDVDRNTGEVIQNGLVYIDSAPDNATIELKDADGQITKGTTNTKMAIPEGKYELVVKKDGYRDWRRSFELKGGSVQRITYPIMLLSSFEERFISDIGSADPAVVTQSPDRRWLLYSTSNLKSYLQYDLSKIAEDKKTPSSEPLFFPDTLFKAPDGTESLEVVEWSTDNKNLLVKHTYGSGYEFIVLNRDQPAASVNINQTLGTSPTKVALRDKAPDSWYVYTQSSGLLQLANLNKTTTDLYTSVVEFKSHGQNVIVYSRKVNDTTQNVYIADNGKNYLLATLPLGTLHLDVARFNRGWYYVVASDKDKKTYIYKNPVASLSSDATVRVAPIAILRNDADAIEKIGFSSNARFIMARSAQTVGVYDAEQNESFKIAVSQGIDPVVPVTWMDGHRILFSSAGVANIFDFDGSNNQTLIPIAGSDSLFFDRDYTVMYSLKKISDNNTNLGLYSTNLRLEADK